MQLLLSFIEIHRNELSAECSYGVPSADEIREHVENCIMQAIDGIMDEKSDRYFVSNGGIEVVATYDLYDPKIIIRFVVEESDQDEF